VAKFKFFGIIVFCLFTAFGAGSAAGQENVTVLIYHKFGEDQYPTTNVSLLKFARQMAYLRDNGYQVLPLAQMAGMLARKDVLPERAVVITIDDGYESVYSGAWPILKKYGYPFTVFLYAKAVEKKYRDFLTWPQIDEMRAAGVDFQDHGYSHYRMGRKPAGLTKAGYADWIYADLKKSRAILTRHLGYRPDFLALPYGEYNSVVSAQCNKIGYKAVFSQDPGSVSSDTGYIIPREPILGYDWSTLEHFKSVLERDDLPLTDLRPDTEPFTGKADQFCATIMYQERYDMRTLRVFVSELGWQSATNVDGKRLCLSNDKELMRRTNRVAISVREKNKHRQSIRFWLLINPDK
jgi:peptidoglycan/xylan/chitin deacetylase (PgdA/CDA1 family)